MTTVVAVMEKVITPGRIFDCARDKKLIAEGSHFFCHGCLVARPLKVQSADPRYCQSCYDFLLVEAALLPPTKRPPWRPRRSIRGGQNNMDSERRGIANSAIMTAPKKRGRRAVELPRAVLSSLIADGIPRTEIAARMGISERTLRRKLKGSLIYTRNTAGQTDRL